MLLPRHRLLEKIGAQEKITIFARPVPNLKKYPKMLKKIVIKKLNDK